MLTHLRLWELGKAIKSQRYTKYQPPDLEWSLCFTLQITARDKGGFRL